MMSCWRRLLVYFFIPIGQNSPSIPEYPNNHLDRFQPTSAPTQGGVFWVPFSSPKTAQVRMTQLKRRLIASWGEMGPKESEVR